MPMCGCQVNDRVRGHRMTTWARILFNNPSVLKHTHNTHTMSQQLLTIETAFLSAPIVKEKLNLTNIKHLRKQEMNAQKKKFSVSLEIAKMVKDGFEWFKSEEGKTAMSEHGLQWTISDFAEKVYGYKKSFMYRLVKVGELPTETIEAFNAECDRVEADGKTAERTIRGLLSYASQQPTDGEGEGGDGEGEGGEGANVERAKAIITLAFKGESFGLGNVSVRLNSDGTTKTTNTIDEIRTAISILMGALNTQPEETLQQVMDVEEEMIED